MNYHHGAVSQEQQQYQHQQQQQQPQYQQQFQQQQQHLYQQQEQAAMAQQLHYQQQAAYPAMQGYTPAMGAPFMFVNMEMPVSSYQQVNTSTTHIVCVANFVAGRKDSGNVFEIFEMGYLEPSEIEFGILHASKLKPKCRENNQNSCRGGQRKKVEEAESLSALHLWSLCERTLVLKMKGLKRVLVAELLPHPPHQAAGHLPDMPQQQYLSRHPLAVQRGFQQPLLPNPVPSSINNK
jgi:hypothetical protein